jgi:molybdenum ABC transporter molybdate-binding protein
VLPARALAIADPAAAPYSAAAVEVMKTLGVCDALTGKIVHGADIAQMFQFVDTGNAEFGFVALSQVIVRPSGSRWIVPANLPWVQDGQAAAEAARRRKFREGLRAGAFSSPRRF